MSEQSRPSTAASSYAQTATSHRSLSHVMSDKVESLTLKKSPTQAEWSGSSKPVLPRDLAWYMPPPREHIPCISYHMMAPDCGCILFGLPQTIRHSPDCMFGKAKLNEAEHTKFLHSTQTCPIVKKVHQFLDRSCPNHKTPMARIKNTREKVSTGLRSIGRKSTKHVKTEEEQQAEDERVPKLLQQWEDYMAMERIEEENKVNARKQINRDAYYAYNAELREQEAKDEVPAHKRFYLFDFFGREGGDLLKPFLPKASSTPHKCAFCETADAPDKLQVLPCGCVVHRLCAADRFIQSQWKPLEKPTCVCKMEVDGKAVDRTFVLRRLVTDFDDRELASAPVKK